MLLNQQQAQASKIIHRGLIPQGLTHRHRGQQLQKLLQRQAFPLLMKIKAIVQEKKKVPLPEVTISHYPKITTTVYLVFPTEEDWNNIIIPRMRQYLRDDHLQAWYS